MRVNTVIKPESEGIEKSYQAGADYGIAVNIPLNVITHAFWKSVPLH